MSRLAFLALSLTLTSSAMAADLKPILFSLFDAGETLAFIPVMDAPRSSGTPFKVITVATSKALLPSCPECIDLKQECGVETLVESSASHEDRLLSALDLAKIKSCIDPKVLVTGAPSRMQLQLMEAFQRGGTKVIAYFDAFSPVLKNSIGSEFLKIADEFWVASKQLADQAAQMNHRGIIQVMGQPTLETWSQTQASTSLDAIRTQLMTEYLKNVD